MLWRPIPMLFQYMFVGNVNLTEVILSFLAITVIITILLPIHEFAHAWSAYKLGDHTAKNYGRLTLNPFAHIDPLGAICMFLMPFGWAKPVPVVPYNASRKITQRQFIALTAAAGPVSNFLFALVFVIIGKIIAAASGDYGNEGIRWLLYFFFSTASMSIWLGVFNLIPVPPLDGSKILMFFLNNKAAYTFERHSRMLFWGLMAVLFLVPMPFNLLLWGMHFLTSAIMHLLDTMTFFIR
jgi:Zn-dependent protease